MTKSSQIDREGKLNWWKPEPGKRNQANLIAMKAVLPNEIAQFFNNDNFRCVIDLSNLIESEKVEIFPVITELDNKNMPKMLPPKILPTRNIPISDHPIYLKEYINN